jgi:ribosomal protein S8
MGLERKQEILNEKEKILKDIEQIKNPIDQEVLRRAFIHLENESKPKWDYWHYIFIATIIKNVANGFKTKGFIKSFTLGASIVGLGYYFNDLKERTIFNEKNIKINNEFERKTHIKL